MVDSLELKGIIAGAVYIGLVIILLGVFLEKYTEVLTFVALGFAIYFAASGKLEEFGGLGLKLKFRQLKEQQIPQKHEEILGGRIVPTDETEVAEKASMNLLQGIILPQMPQKRYTTLSIRQGVHIDRDVLASYLNELLAFDFFKHVIFINNTGMFSGHIFAETLLRILQRRDGSLAQHADSIVESINNWHLEDVTSIVRHFVKTGSTYDEVLRKIREIGRDYIPIIDESGRFAGTISKKEITDMIFDKILLPPR